MNCIAHCQNTPDILSCIQLRAAFLQLSILIVICCSTFHNYKPPYYTDNHLWHIADRIWKQNWLSYFWLAFMPCDVWNGTSPWKRIISLNSRQKCILTNIEIEMIGNNTLSISGILIKWKIASFKQVILANSKIVLICY